MNNYLLDLIKNFEKLPGIGRKTAERLAYFVLEQDKEKSYGFAESIVNAVENIKNCSICNRYSVEDVCNICSDLQRNNELLCVVESSKNISVIEKTGEFLGKYFVLGKLLNPLEGIGPDEINFNQLKENIRRNDVKEIILAISPSIEGESTIQFISEELSDSNLKITRLSTGLPFGGNIDYSNMRTLGEAITRRYKL